MFDRPEKSVVKAPFTRIDPLKIGSKRVYAFAEKLAAFEAFPTWFSLANLMVAALTS